MELLAPPAAAVAAGKVVTVATEAAAPPPVIFVIGATGAGKSAAALALARHLTSRGLRPQLLNADASQMFRGLPIATNKPTAEELAALPHHFVACLSCDGPEAALYTAPQYARDCVARIAQLRAADPARAVPLVVGGTNYYLQAVMLRHVVLSLADIDGDPADAALTAAAPSVRGGPAVTAPPQRATPDAEARGRRQLERGRGRDSGSCLLGLSVGAQLAATPTSDTTPGVAEEAKEAAACRGRRAAPNGGTAAPPPAAASLWAELHAVDPAMAARWHPNDTRRIARSLQLHRASGGVLPSALRACQPPPALRYPPPYTAAAAETVVDAGNPGTVVVWVDTTDTAPLFSAIDRRVDAMVANGLLQEARALFREQRTVFGGSLSPGDAVAAPAAADDDAFDAESSAPASGLASAIGFKEFLPALFAEEEESQEVASSQQSDDGLAGRRRACQLKVARLWAEGIAQVKVNTRRYARQQRQWINNRFVKKFGRFFQQPPARGAVFCRIASDTCAREGIEVGALAVTVLECCWPRVRAEEETLRCNEETAVARWEKALHAGALTVIAGGEEKSTTAPTFAATGATGATVAHVLEEGAGPHGDDDDVAVSFCDLCQKHLAGSVQRRAHFASKGHKGATRRLARAAALAEMGIEVKPKGGGKGSGS